MKRFKVWIEAKQEKLRDYLDVVLNSLNLDTKKGASTPVDSLNQQNLMAKLENLEVYKLLPTKTKDLIRKKIESDNKGTVLDIIKTMAGYQ